MLTEEKLIRLRNQVWHSTICDGTRTAEQNAKQGVTVDHTHIVWELLREAAFVSRAAYAVPPRSGFPAKSALPDGVDEGTVWQMVSAFLKGEIENLPSDETKAPRPSAKQITRAEVMLELWHHVALIEKGDRKRLKRAVYLEACGMRPRAVQELTGLNYQQLWRAKKDVCLDVWEKITQLSRLRG